MSRVAVIQPHYLPWTGYYAMMDSVDMFVFYDTVQFSHQSWQQRNKIKINNDMLHWLTVPVVRQYQQRIDEVRINNDTRWKKDHWETIRQNYVRCRCFQPYAAYLENLYLTEWNYLSEMNIYYTQMIGQMLNIKMPRIKRASDFQLEGSKTDRLLMLLKKIGATEYISGMGAKDYIEEDKFQKANIKLTWFNYKPPSYPQRGIVFIPYLSAIDLLFNVGEEAINYIREGVNDLKPN